MPTQLSERETIVLKVLLDNMPHGSAGSDLVHGVRTALGSIGVNDVTPAGVHRTAASLCRKNLAWRSGTSKLQSYKITQPGRDVLDGRNRSWRTADIGGGVMMFTVGKTYEVTGQDGVTRSGVYTGREQGAGVVFDVFQTHDRIPGQPGFVQVFLVATA